MNFIDLQEHFRQINLQTETPESKKQARLLMKGLLAFKNEDAFERTKERDVLLQEGLEPEIWVGWALDVEDFDALEGMSAKNIKWDEFKSLESGILDRDNLLIKIFRKDNVSFLNWAIEKGNLNPDFKFKGSVVSSEKSSLLNYALTRESKKCAEFLITKPSIYKNKDTISEAALIIERLAGMNLSGLKTFTHKTLDTVLDNLVLSHIHSKDKLNQSLLVNWVNEFFQINYNQRESFFIFDYKPAQYLKKQLKEISVALNSNPLIETAFIDILPHQRFSINFLEKLKFLDEQRIKKGENLQPQFNLPLKMLNHLSFWRNPSFDIGAIPQLERIFEKPRSFDSPIEWNSWKNLIQSITKTDEGMQFYKKKKEMFSFFIQDMWFEHLSPEALKIRKSLDTSVIKRVNDALMNGTQEALVLELSTLPTEETPMLPRKFSHI